MFYSRIVFSTSLSCSYLFILSFTFTSLVFFSLLPKSFPSIFTSRYTLSFSIFSGIFKLLFHSHLFIIPNPSAFPPASVFYLLFLSIILFLVSFSCYPVLVALVFSSELSLPQESEQEQKVDPAASLLPLRQVPWPQGTLSSHAPPTTQDGAGRGGQVGQVRRGGLGCGWAKVINRLH